MVCGYSAPRMAAGDVHKQLQELEGLAQELGVRVSYDVMTGPGHVGSGSGGLCKVRGEWRVIMDRRLKPVERLHVLSEALRSRFDTEAHFVSPRVRSLLTARPSEDRGAGSGSGPDIAE